jgi:small-conductance mechanosensitive channel
MLLNFFLLETTIFGDLLSGFITAVPGVVGAIVIIIIGFIVAKILRKVIRGVLEKVGIDKVGDKLNEIEIVDKANVKVKFSSVLSTIVYYFLILFFTVAATEVLGMPAVSELVKNIFEFIPKVVVALIILVIGILVADALKNVVTTACNSLGISSGKLIGNLIFYFLLINVVILALSQAGINTDFLSQNLSILIGGVAFAFAIGYGIASKDVVSNYLAGYYSGNIVKVGDQVKIDDVTGTVVDVSKSTIVVETSDSNVVFPLNWITTSKIEIFK